MKKWKSYLFWILFTEAVGLAAAVLTGSGVQQFNLEAVKPPFTPPAILFPIVWTLLYALMGVGIARIRLSPPSQQRTHATNVYLLQLAFNFFWSILFFNLNAYGLAFLWILVLWALIAWMISAFSQIDPLAAKLQLPYFIWVTFAAFLNLGVWALN